MTTKKIVFGPSGDLSPIARLLPQEEYEFYIAVDNNLVNDFRNLDIQAQNLFSVLGDDAEFTINQDAVQVIHGMTAAAENYQSKNSAHFADFSAYTYRIIPFLVSLVKSLEILRPDIIVVHNDADIYMRTLCLWAKENDIPVLHVPHAIDIRDRMDTSELGTDIHDLLVAPNVAVGGDYQAQWYVDRGATHVYKTGIPKFDRYINMPIPRKDAAQRMLKLDHDKPVLAYIASWTQSTNMVGIGRDPLKYFEMFCEAVSHVPKLQLVVNTHPARSVSVQAHAQIMEKVGTRNGIVSKGNLDVVLSASDVVFSYGPSNVLFDAAHYSTRLLTTHGLKDDNEVLKVGLDADEGTIIEKIIGVLNTPVPRYNALLQKYVGMHDGRAAERVAKVIQELANAS